jgi:hypothetical protein
MYVNKRYIVDEQGNPKEVIIEEFLGWDLDDKAVQQLREARRDRESGKKDAYVDLDSI